MKRTNPALARAALFLGLMMAVGCGGGKGGGGAPAAAPPVLESISVTPSTLTLDLLESTFLECEGHYDNGTTGPVSADWCVSSGGVTLTSYATDVPWVYVAWA